MWSNETANGGFFDFFLKKKKKINKVVYYWRLSFNKIVRLMVDEIRTQLDLDLLKGLRQEFLIMGHSLAAIIVFPLEDDLI